MNIERAQRVIVRSIIAAVVGAYVYVGMWAGAFIGAMLYPVAYGYKLAQMRLALIDAERRTRRGESHM